VLGLASNPALPGVIYAAGKLQANASQSPPPHENVVVQVDVTSRNSWSVISTLHNNVSRAPCAPASCVSLTPSQTVGNGLACHHSTGLLYTTSEGNFEPGTGVVYEIDPRTHTATVILQGLWAADGLWLDQGRNLLYVGLLFTSEVLVWDIASRSVLRTIPKAIPGLLDDFCLDHSGGAIIAAAWTDDSIVMFNTSTGIPPHPPSLPSSHPLHPHSINPLVSPPILT
jgi:hypothetical protein